MQEEPRHYWDVVANKKSTSPFKMLLIEKRIWRQWLEEERTSASNHPFSTFNHHNSNSRAILWMKKKKRDLRRNLGYWDQKLKLGLSQMSLFFFFFKKSVKLDDSRQVSTESVFNLVDHNSSVEIVSNLAEADTTRVSRTRLGRYFEPWSKMEREKIKPLLAKSCY